MSEKNLGQYLRKIRKSYGYTQEFVASQIDVSRQAYSHYENNRAIPPNDTCFNIAKIYDVPADMLIELSLLREDNVSYEVPNTDQMELDDFLHYIESEQNLERFKHLTNKEKKILYYFNTISLNDQEEMIEFLKIKKNRNK